MKSILAVLVMTFGLSVFAQIPQFPPVPFNDVNKKNFGLWANTGWVLDTDGQKRDDVKFVSEGALPRIYLRENAQLSFTLNSLLPDTGGLDTLRRLDMALVGASAAFPQPIGSSVREQVRHFYFPHCGATGITNVPGYNRVVYPGIYPNIDLWVFSGQLSQKVMFVVWPGADPNHIKLEFTGQNELLVDVQGWLRLQLEDKWLSLPQLMAYQFDQNDAIQPLLWSAQYEPVGNSGVVSLGYNAYDPQKPLVLLAGAMAMGGQNYEEDGLCWSTYHGDNGLDNALDVRTDEDGNIYVAGNTSSTLVQFPADPGVTLAASGNVVAYMTRFTAAHQLNWTLFYGGNVLGSAPGTAASAIAIREEPDRHIFLVGQTWANDLWCMANGAAYIDSIAGLSSQGYIFEINEIGDPIWATYFGEGNMAIEGATITAASNLVICGYGYAGSDLPEVQYGPPPGSLDQAFASNQDAFVAYFDPARQLYMRSWFGGAQSETAQVVRSVPGKIVFAGHAGSGNIDMEDPGGGAFTQAFGGGNTDCYLVELDENGVVQWSTYIGGVGSDHLGDKGLDIDKDGDVFLCGRASPGLQIVPGPNWCDSLASPNSMNGLNGFVARFSGIDRSPLWISYLGDGYPHMPQAIVHGADELINVAGWTTDEDLPHVLQDGTYNQNGVYETYSGSFLVQFEDDQSIWHATWFGGDASTNNTDIRALAPVEQGVYAVGSTHKLADPLAYFPLDDEQGMAWFDGDYNHLAQTGNGSDAFLTFFCAESGVGMNEAATNTSGLRVACIADGTTLLLIGLAPAAGNYRIIDMLGRMKAQGRIPSHDGTATIALDRSLSAGCYIIAIDGHAPLRFVRP